MGGPPTGWTLFLLLLSAFCSILALPTEKPSLLRFILNVKQGIREPAAAFSTPSPQKTLPGSGGQSSGGGFNAISIGSVGQGQSKSSTSQSSKTGGFGVVGGQAKAGSNQSGKGELQKQIGGGGITMKAPAPTATPLISSNAAVKAKTNDAEDPYGLEIGGETTTRTPSTTTSSSSSPTTSLATTTTTASTTTKIPSCGPDVLFVLDSTGSVRLVYDDQRKYILDVAQQMDIGPNGQHVGLILYSSKLKQRIVVGLDEPQGKEQFLQTVRELPYHGGITATGTALGLTAKALAKRRQNKRTLVVVLTDGFTYDEWEAPSQNLKSLGPGVDVIVAGDVKIYAQSILEKIAGDPARVLLGEENKPKALDYLRCR